MKTRALTVLFLLVGAVTLSQTFTTSLSGGREPNSSTGGRGLAVVSLDGSSLHYFLWTKSIDAPTGAHIHLGRAGETGSIVLDFTPSFTSPVTGVFLAEGSVALDSTLSQAILARPSAYYVNVHTASFPGGAVRGQLLGDGPTAGTLVTSLRGSREPAGGDLSGSGEAAIVIDGVTVYYYVFTSNLASPTAAEISAAPAGIDGNVVVDLGATFVNGVATGSVTTSTTLAADLLVHPDAYYLNVHTTAFPGGALRGQLGATETDLYFPVLTHAAGQGTSFFKSNLRIANLADEDATVYLEWFPAGAGGARGPAAISAQVIAAGGDAVFDDVISTVFAVSGRGAMRVVTSFPIIAVANTFNDQRPAGLGTFGQFVEGLPLDRAYTSGALIYNSNRPKADAADFRTNLGYFNPSASPVDVIFNVRTPGGALVVDPIHKTIPGLANDLNSYYLILGGIPAGAQTQANFLISYSANTPVFILSSVVDNRTDDGFNQPAAPLPAALVKSAATANHPPKGTITSPGGDVTVTTGQAVSFAGTVSDPDGDAVDVVWTFGDGNTSAQLVPGNHTYATAAVYTVTMTATDAHGLSDPAPPTRKVTVQPPANQPPTATITAPAGNVTITAGQTVSFAGTASDPDGDTVTVVWTFGDTTSSTSLAPGNHTYASAGTYTVTLTATDSKGLADPAPPTRTITVNAVVAATLSTLQTEIFTPICARCHPPNRNMDLSAGNTYSNTVNVHSVEQPTLFRVKPGDPDNSYLYQKLASGAMPFGGPPLTADQLAKVRGWIQVGAANN
jgi:hypothetical protein